MSRSESHRWSQNRQSAFKSGSGARVDLLVSFGSPKGAVTNSSLLSTGMGTESHADQISCTVLTSQAAVLSIGDRATSCVTISVSACSQSSRSCPFSSTLLLQLVSAKLYLLVIDVFGCHSDVKSHLYLVGRPSVHYYSVMSGWPVIRPELRIVEGSGNEFAHRCRHPCCT